MGLEGGPGAISEGHVGRWIAIHRLLSRGGTWSNFECELVSMQSEWVGLIPNEVSDFRPAYRRGKRGKRVEVQGKNWGETKTKMHPLFSWPSFSSPVLTPQFSHGLKWWFTKYNDPNHAGSLPSNLVAHYIHLGRVFNIPYPKLN